MLRTSNALILLASMLFFSAASGQDRVRRESVDLNAVHRIKTAEFGLAGDKSKSQIVDLAFNLTDRFGPRLTNSPQFRRAAEWTIQQLRDWGMSNVHLEKWGGRQGCRCRVGSVPSSPPPWLSPHTSN